MEWKDTNKNIVKDGGNEYGGRSINVKPLNEEIIIDDELENEDFEPDTEHEAKPKYKETVDKSSENNQKQKLFKCLFCEKIFTLTSDLITHYKSHSVKSYKCGQCKKKFAFKTLLKQHSQIHTAQKKGEKDIVTGQIDKKECGDTSDTNSLKEEALTKEIILINDETECDSNVNNQELLGKIKEDLYEDFKMEITEPEIMPKSEKNMDKTFKDNLQIKSFKFSFCEKSFSLKSELITHYSSHSVKTYECEQCRRKFMFEIFLKQHMKMHEAQKADVKVNVNNQIDKEESEDRTTDINTLKEEAEEIILIDDEIENDNLKSRELLGKIKKESDDDFKMEILEHEVKSQNEQNVDESNENKQQKIFKCSFCEKRFTLKSDLITHFRSHSDKTYKCDQCQRKFKFEINLKKHIKMHESQKAGEIDNVINQIDKEECEDRTPYITTLKEAEEILLIDDEIETDNLKSRELLGKIKKESDDDFKMEILEHEVKPQNEQNMDESNENKQQKIFKCSFCEKRFTLKSDLITHFSSHSDKTYKCEQCQRKFTFEIYLKKHMKMHKKQKTDEKDNVANQIDKEECEHRLTDINSLKEEIEESDDCFKMEVLAEELKSQTKETNNNCSEDVQKMNTYKCLVCHNKFRSERGLSYHKIRVHMKDKPFKCDFCDSQFILSSSKDIHIKFHENKKAYQCSTCNEKFAFKKSLRVHVKTHATDFKNQNCEFCGKGFKHERMLLTHLKSHTNPKKYKCSQCDKKLSTELTLFNHKRLVHATSFSHQCYHCTKKFEEKSELHEHLKTHVNKKHRYVCENCPKKCFRLTQYNVHRKTHGLDAYVESPYKCKRCDKEFRQKNLLDKHMEKCNQPTNPSCQKCNYKYSNRYSLSKHILFRREEELFECTCK